MKQRCSQAAAAAAAAAAVAVVVAAVVTKLTLLFNKIIFNFRQSSTF
jgi:hypothetical protein